MTADALPLFRRICRTISSRGDRGLTLEEIRDAAGLAEALACSDSRRTDAFALRLELSGHELEAVVRSEEQHGESAGPAPRMTTITGPSTPQTALAPVSESAEHSRAGAERRSGPGGRA